MEGESSTTVNKINVPNVYRQFLEKTVEEVANSVSHERFSEIFEPLTLHTSEIYGCIQEEVVKSMRVVIDGLSKDGDIDNKLNKLSAREGFIQSDGEVWRPTTGEVDLLSIEGNALETRKRKLLEMVKAIDDENEKLLDIIKEKKEILNKCDDKFKNF